MMWFTKGDYQRKGRISIWACLVVLGLGLTQAQPAVSQMRGGQQRGGQQMQQMQQAQQVQISPLQQAQADIMEMARIIINDYVLTGKPLQPADIELINEDLNQAIRPFEQDKRFTAEYKSYLYLVETLLAHYQGNRTLAMQKAQQAYEIVRKSPSAARDVAELVVALALSYGDYDTAKSLLREMKSGSAVAGQTANITPSEIPQTITQIIDTSDPNNPVVTNISAGRDRQTTLPSTRRPSRFVANTGVDTTLQANANRNAMLNQQMGAMPPGQFGGAISNPAGMGAGAAQPVETLFKLPIPYMPYENLGQDFPTVSLRGMNGSYLHFQPGQGQMLCALLWTLPANQGQLAGQPDPTMMGMNPRVMGNYPAPTAATGIGAAPEPDVETVPEIAYDLTTNAEQFRGLFQRLQQNILEGKMQFVGINFDQADEYFLPQVASLTFESSWPWTTCVAVDPINLAQWQMESVAGSAVMLLVDTQGKVRYVGPVGGFLPKMIIDNEINKTRPSRSNILPDLARASGYVDPRKAAQQAQKVRQVDTPEEKIAQGMLAGRNFVCQDAQLKNGVLHLSQGQGIFADLEVQITLFLKPGENPVQKTYSIDRQSGVNVPFINLKWLPAGGVLPVAERFTSDYQMQLEFGNVMEGKISGKIDLKLPKQRGAITGEFVANIKN